MFVLTGPTASLFRALMLEAQEGDDKHLPVEVDRRRLFRAKEACRLAHVRRDDVEAQERAARHVLEVGLDPTAFDDLGQTVRVLGWFLEQVEEVTVLHHVRPDDVPT